MIASALLTEPQPNAVAPARAVPEPDAGLLLCLQAALLSRPSCDESAGAFVAELARALDCERASVGLAKDHGVAPLAVSTGQAIDPAGDAARALGLAMNEAFDQAATIIHPAPPGTRALVQAAHQRLLRPGVGGVVSVPLPAHGSIAGVLTVERRAGTCADWEVAFLEDLASFAGPVLALKDRAERPWTTRLADAATGRLAACRTHHPLRTRLFLGGIAAGVIAAVLVPIPYQVSAPARLEGMQQRAIVAPADGYLRSAAVRAGDHVRAGQVLAELAGEDLALERNRRESEWRQHENAYRAALARADRAQMVIHQARAGEAEAMLALVDAQIERARITAPFDGVIIQGDLNGRLGAPVSRGDALLTMAPDESFRLVVEVDETDIAAVDIGSTGRLVLAARPDAALEFRVRRIVPLATAADGRNFFEVEGVPESAGADLRPGLRGFARIEAGHRSAWWIVTHRAFAWLRLRLWSFAGWSP